MKAILFVATLLCFSSFAREDCRSMKGVKVLSEYMDYDYKHENGETRLIKKEKRLSQLFEGWSEVAGSLYRIYFESTSGRDVPDKVEVSYRHENKLVYARKYDLEKTKVKGRLVLSGFTFNDGVVDRKLRPGKQTFRFTAKGQEVCFVNVRHIYAEEF